MHNKYLSFGEALGFGWDTVKSNLGFAAAAALIAFLLPLPAEMLGQFARFLPSPVSPEKLVALAVAATLIKTIVWIGFTRIALSFCDGQRPSLQMLIDPSGCLIRCIATSILYSLCVAGVFIACIAPLVLLPTLSAAAVFAVPMFVAGGVAATYFTLKFSLCYFFVIDRQLGPIDALRASSRTTLGAKWQLLLFGLVCGLVNLAGFLCFIVGLLVTVPLVMIAMAHAYRQLAVQTPSLMELEADRCMVLSPGESAPQVAAGLAAPAGGAPQPAAQVSPTSAKAGSTIWVRLSILSVLIIVAITAYTLWPNLKGRAGISTKQESASGLTVNGIVHSDLPRVIINGRMLRTGDTIEGARVIDIARDYVELERSGRRWKEYMPGSKGSSARVTAMPTLLVLGAPRCPACRQMTPVLSKLQSGYARDFRVQYINVDKAGASAAKYRVRAIPTVIFCNGQGQELYRHVGYCSEDDIISLWKQLGFGF
jgi:thioredoxin 1